MDFASLYQRHARDVLRFALYLSANYSQAQDIAAETFARAWVARDRIRVGTVKAYLFEIAHNLYRDQAKAHAVRAVALEEGDTVADVRAGPEAIAHDRQRLRMTLAALRRMSERDRALLTMAAVDGMPHEQIAAALGMSVGAVKVRIHRARLMLNRILAEEEHP